MLGGMGLGLLDDERDENTRRVSVTKVDNGFTITGKEKTMIAKTKAQANKIAAKMLKA